MGFIGDQVNDMAEQKAFAEGGYMALWKLRIVRFAYAVEKCSCCS